MNGFKLGVGPMSSEAIEASFRFSHYNRKSLMLIPSKNQIDYNGGYVNNWNTKDFVAFINRMKEVYPNNEVKLCRDHCGPGFNGIQDLEDTYKTIDSDIKNGFDLIHVDFCKFNGTKEERFKESKKVIQYCLDLNPAVSLEIGTDENEGMNFSLINLKEIEEEINFFKGFCKPKFYVVQTGTLVKEINQVGSFNKDFTEKVHNLLNSKGIELKEHNADYLSKEELDLRKGLVDAMNIAPQLGVVQTMTILKKCLTYGINFDKFLEKVYVGGKWKKWVFNNSPGNKMLLSIVAGHYHFASPEYKEMVRKLEDREEIEEDIMNKLMEVISHYH